jgi:hypothetical protein
VRRRRPRAAADRRAPDAPAAAGGRGDPDHARGGVGERASGDAVFDRQGQLGDAAPGDEGLLPVEAAVPAGARRHDVQVLRHVRVPRQHGEGTRPRPDRAPEPRVPGEGDQPVRSRLGGAHRHVEDRGPQAGDRRQQVRSVLRWRPPRRGEVAGQGADLLDPLRAAPVGSEASAARVVAGVQRPAQQR